MHGQNAAFVVTGDHFLQLGGHRRQIEVVGRAHQVIEVRIGELAHALTLIPSAIHHHWPKVLVRGLDDQGAVTVEVTKCMKLGLGEVGVFAADVALS